jgi:hypothetical protein
MCIVHSTASAQSRVATLHLVVHELLAFLVVLAEIAMPALSGIGYLDICGKWAWTWTDGEPVPI